MTIHRLAAAILVLAATVLPARPCVAQDYSFTKTTLTASPNPSATGQGVTFTATVSVLIGLPATPTGIVKFAVDSTWAAQVTLVGGVASFTTSGLSEGVHTVRADYQGDGLFISSTSPTQSQSVYRATGLVVSSSVNPSAAGQPVRLSATVVPGLVAAGTPTGTMTFTDNGVAIGGPVPLSTAGLSVTAGGNFTCGLTTDRAVFCWGYSFDGDPGNDPQSPNMVLTPVPVVGLQGGVVQVAAGDAHACALTSAGAVFCWGQNAAGQLGDGTRITRTAPVPVVGLGSGITAIAAGGAFTCAMTSAGGVKCWGDNTYDQLGVDTLGVRQLAPVDVVGLTGPATSITAGADFACVTIQWGYAMCWGNNSFGAIGDGQVSAPRAPTQVPTPEIVGSIAAGRKHTCAITLAQSGARTVRCWGDNTFGQLGDGTAIAHATQAPVNGLPPTATRLVAGDWHTCAALANGDVWCWGDNDHGQLGDGSTTTRPSPVVVATPRSVQALTAGSFHTCAVTSSGSLLCWGSNDVDQVGGTRGLLVVSTPNEVIPPTAAAVTTTMIGRGNHTVTATYSGDATFAPSAGSLTQAVTALPTSTTLTSSSAPSHLLEPVTFTATIAASLPPGLTPGGTVTFNDGAVAIGTAPVAGGAATYTTATLGLGPHAITATYAGDASFNASASGPLTQVVNPAASTTTLTSSLNPSEITHSVTFTATVATTPGIQPIGVVTFKDAGSTIGSATLVAGTAAFTPVVLGLGTHSIVAVYGGTAAVAASTSAPLAQTVTTAATTLTLSATAAPWLVNQPVSFTMAVSATSGGTPTGTVAVTDGGTLLATPALNASGVATFTTSGLAAGPHTIGMSYAGDGVYGPSSAMLTPTVDKNASATTLSSTPNPSALDQPVTLTATVAGAGSPSGTVVFKDGTLTLGSAPIAGGVAALTTAQLAGGTHPLTAVYNGDAAFLSSTSASIAQSVASGSAAVVTLASTSNPSIYGPLTLAVSLAAAPPVTRTPTGTVDVADNGTTFARLTLVDGAATYALPFLSYFPVGTHTFTAVYSGDSSFAGAAATPLVQVVNPAPAGMGPIMGYVVTTSLGASLSTGGTQVLSGTPYDESGNLTLEQWNVAGANAYGEILALPFPVTLYDQQFAAGASVWVTPYGFMQFVPRQPDVPFGATLPGCLPNPNFQQILDYWIGQNKTINPVTLAPYWTELWSRQSAHGVYYQTIGMAPNREFHVRWDMEVPGGGSAQFEVVLYEGRGGFDYVYGHVDPNGASTTIGLQRSWDPAPLDTGSTTYRCGGVAPVPDGTRLTFSAVRVGETTLVPTLSRNPAVFGQPATLGAQVVQFYTGGIAYGPNTGTVSFTEGSDVLAGPLPVTAGIVDGTAVALATGTHVITATYSGDPAVNVAPATATITHVVVGVPQTVTFGALADVTLGAAPIALTASASSGLPVSFSIVSGPATVSGSVLTITGGGSITVRASQAGDAQYAAAPDVDRTFSVAKASQTISFAALPNVTGAASPITLTASATSGLVVSLTVLSGPATVSGKVLTLTGAGTVTVRASQAGDNGYLAAANVDRSFSVTKASQTITFGQLPDITATGPPLTLSATASSGLPVTFDLVPPPPNTVPIATLNGSVLTPIGAGLVTVVAAQDGNALYNAASFVFRGLLITKGTQVVSFSAPTIRPATGGAFAVAATSSANLPLTLSIQSGPATISGSTITPTGGGTVVIDAANPGNTLWDAVDSTVSVVLTKSDQAITFDPLPDITLANPAIILHATASSALPITFTVTSGVATISGSTVFASAAGPVTVRASQPGDPFYNAAPPVDRSFTASKIPQAITCSPVPDQTFGAAPVPLDATSSLGRPVDFTVVSGPGTITFGHFVTLLAAGTIDVRASSAGDGSVEAASTDCVINVAKAAQTITFGPIADRQFSRTAFALGATASSNLAVSYLVVSGPATVAGNLVTTTGVGVVTIRASQPGSDGYLAAASVDRSFSVTKADQTITFAPLPDKTYGDAPFGLTATASSGLPVSFQASGPISVSGNVATIIAAGQAQITVVQAGDDLYSPASASQFFLVMPARLTVKANDASRAYGTAPQYTAAFTGFVNGDTPATWGGTVAFSALNLQTNRSGDLPTSDVGAYTIVPTGSSDKYSLVTVNGTLTVTPAPLTLTVADVSAPYGSAVNAFSPFFQSTFTGLVAGDALGVSYTPPAQPRFVVGTYPVGAIASGARLTNYTLTVIPGHLTIAKATLTVRALDGSRLYGTANPLFSATFIGLQFDDTQASLGGTLSFATDAVASSPAGPYAIVPSGLTSPNYAISYANGTLTIGRASLFVMPNGVSRPYGAANPAFSVSYSGFLAGDGPSALGGGLTFSTAATSASPVGTYPLTVSGLTSTNYVITYGQNAVIVDRATLIVAATSAQRGYWDPNPPLTGVVTGLVNGDTVTPVFTTTATADSTWGSYPIMAGLADPPDRLTNYAVGLVPGTLTVTSVVPRVDTLGPGSALVGDAATWVDVNGNNFVPWSYALVNGAPAQTEFVSRTLVRALVPAAALANVGAVYITVNNTGNGGGLSAAVALFVNDTGAPVDSSATATIPSTGSATVVAGGEAPGAPESIAATATGSGTVSVAQYAGNPSEPTGFATSGGYFDVFVAPGSHVTTMAVTNCALDGGTTVLWFNGTAWAPVQPQSYDASTKCVTMTLRSSGTSPTIGQLTGTYFAAVATAAITPGAMEGGGSVKNGGTRTWFGLDVKEKANGADRGWVRIQARTKGQMDRFVSDALTAVIFADDPASTPGKKKSGEDSVLVSGTGRFNGLAGYTFDARAVDGGEPGRNRDQVSIVVRSPLGAVVLTLDATLDAGNIQSTRLAGPRR
jgi:alpha-tubulin suppressor-like RCC1 family protein